MRKEREWGRKKRAKSRKRYNENLGILFRYFTVKAYTNVEQEH